MSKTSAPSPYGPLPSARQLRWHELETYCFVHYTVNAFTNREWGLGDESPAIFNPTAFDADQIVGAAAAGGLRGLILTAKHHDGFCLWPSRYTEHSVKHSPWRGGQGDMVREFADACARQGLQFGVYLSPWDRNHAEYGRPAYVDYYRNQLRELMTEYGPLFEIWHDGANGGDGYYGGACETRAIDSTTYYEWPETWAMMRELQPDAVIFSDAGPDIRWVGNEEGRAGEPCWATVTPDGWWPGKADQKLLNSGFRDGTKWLPAEADVSIRPGWFYHAAEDDQVRTPENLMELYLASVGRGSSFLLNLPPDQRGLIHENDVASLTAFGRHRRETFATNLAAGATLTASNQRGGDAAYAPANLLDGSRDTYWASDDDQRTPELTLSFAQPVTFNLVRLREYLPLGQRVDDWALEVDQAGTWQPFTAASAIGACRMVRGETVTTSRVRLRITRAAACPALTELGLFVER